MCEGKGASIGIGVEINWENEITDESKTSSTRRQRRKLRKRKTQEYHNERKGHTRNENISMGFGNLRNQDIIRKLCFLRWNRESFFVGLEAQRKCHASASDNKEHRRQNQTNFDNKERKKVTWNI